MTILFLIGIHAFIGFIIILFTWIFYLITKRHTIIDITWALGFIVHAIFDGVYFLYLNPLTSLTTLLTITTLLLCIFLWGLRLALFLFITRILKGHEDKRYQSIRKSYGSAPHFNTFLNFLLQGFLQLVVSISFIPLVFADTVLPVPIIITNIALIAIAGEFLSDWQLYLFKKSKASGFLRTGLWKFSRHPNYFFDIVFWTSIASFTYYLTGFWIVFFGPISLYLIMKFVTGRITEEHSFKKYGEAFTNYKQSTPMIFPFKLRGNS